jgi:sugar phosphate isomerase/epimerase
MDVMVALKAIKDHGYEGVELSLDNVHLDPMKALSGRMAAIRSYAADIGLPIVCVAAGNPDLLGAEPFEPSLMHPDLSGRKSRIALIKKCLAVAAALGSPMLTINSGKRRPEVGRSQATDYLYQGLREALAEAGDVRLAMEPEPGFFVGTTVEAISTIKEIDDSRYCLTLDIGHVFCGEPDCYGAVRRALPHARHVHIEDIKDGIHYHEIPGEGDIDFTRILEMIEGSGYRDYVSVELHNHEDRWEDALTVSRRYLLDRMAKVSAAA